ncbi:AraC family transcriptional regulator, partial [Mycobacterium kansasii]
MGEIGHRILFDARAAFVHIPAAVLYDVCRFSDPVAYRIGIAELRRVYEQRRPNSYTQLVRAQFDADPARADGARIAA